MILNYVLNNMGSLLDCPFMPQKKNAITPEVGSALIGGVSNILGSIFGASSQSSANDTNIQIARETNQANKDMLKSQQQFALDMWNKQNEYNKPENQVRLYQQGNINPSAVFGNNSGSIAGSVGLPSAAPMQGATVQAYDPSRSFSEVGNQVAQAVNSYYQNRLAESQIHKTDAETQTIGDLRPYQMKQLAAIAKREDFLGEMARLDYNYYMAIQGQRISQAFNDTRMQEQQQELVRQQTFGHQLQNKLYQIQIAYAPKLNDAQLRQYYETVNQIRANIGLINSNRMLTDEQRLSEIQHRVGTIIDNGMKGLDYKLKDETYKYSVGIAKENLYQMEDARFERPWNFYQKHMGRSANFLLTPGSSGAAGSYMDMQNSRDRWNHYDSKFRPRR